MTNIDVTSLKSLKVRICNIVYIIIYERFLLNKLHDTLRLFENNLLFIK